MELKAADIEYFQRGIHENPQFWSRFGGRPRLAGASVMDVGCGFGSLCIDMAKAGAARVVGLDIGERTIAFAQANLQQNYPELQDVVTFLQQDIEDHPLEEFDYIVSKDSFEHIVDIAGVLAEMKKRLKPGGRIYTGFGPLYNSPTGDHGTAKIPLPWAHILIGRERLIARVNQRWKKLDVRSLHDMGINGYSFAEHRRFIENSGLDILYFETNRSEKSRSQLFSLIRRIPPLTEYFTHNIYCILERKT
jgi:SAM-dependent methyltransferase